VKTEPTEPNILVISWNRPDKTREILRNLENSKAREGRIYLFCDGPKGVWEKGGKEQLEHEENQAVLRAWAAQRDLEGLPTRLRLEETNLGNRTGPATALKWFFSECPYGTVLEDDIVPSEELWDIHPTLLHQHQNNGYLVIGGGQCIPEAGSLIIRTKTHQLRAWSSWAQEMLPITEAILNKEPNPWTKHKTRLLKGLRPKTKLFLTKEFLRLENRPGWSWAYTVLQHQLASGKEALTPTVRLHTNLGFDGSGHNCRSFWGRREDASPKGEIQRAISKGMEPKEDQAAEAAWEWRTFGHLDQTLGRALHKITLGRWPKAKSEKSVINSGEMEEKT
jgi:hypothetical protein